MRRAPLLMFVFAFLAGRTHAQPSRVIHWSLEAHIAGAEFVVVGPIVQVNRKVLKEKGSRDERGMVEVNGHYEYAPALKVQEVLKGDLKGVVDDLRFKFSLGEDKRYEQWREAGNVALWFLGPKPRPGQGREWRMIVFGKAAAAEALFGGRPEPPVFAMDFTVLKDEKAILEHARKYARTCPRILPTDMIRYGAPWHDLVVPVEPALEPLAKRLIASPGDFVLKGEKVEPRDRYQLRRSGVQLLRHFRSDANVKILKSLLDDPLEDFESSLILQHPVRVKAFEVLLHWHIDTPLPNRPEEITYINLWHSNVTDAQVGRLTALKNLVRVELSDTRVTDACLKVFAGMGQLTHLSLERTQVTKAGVEKLRKTLPRCEITH